MESVDQRTVRPASMVVRLIEFMRVREGQLVTNDDIIAALWGRETGRNQNNMRVLLTMVRRKLKADGEPFEIINEHGRGYRLVPHYIQRSGVP